MENIIHKIKHKKIVSRTIIMAFSLLLSAVIYNVFLLPMNLVTGGSNGIATITNYLYNIDPALMILFISIACIIISLLYLDFERTTGTIIASLMYPLFVEITAPIAKIFVANTSDMFIIIIIAGVLSGIANGLMYKTGYSNGGLPVICQVLYKYFKIPIAKSSLFINLVIVGTGSIFFGLTNAMYAIILLYINSLVLDRVLLGISKNKAFYIITTEEKVIKEYIIDKLKHSVTVFDVKGGFLEKKKRVLLTVIPSREYYRVTEGIKLLDKEAFFVVTDAYQVEGGK